MKKLIRKLAGAVIAFTMVFGMIPMAVFAVEGSYTVILDPNGGKVTGTETKLTDAKISTSGSAAITDQEQNLGLTSTGETFFITEDRFSKFHQTEFKYVLRSDANWLNASTGHSLYTSYSGGFPSCMADYFSGFDQGAGFTVGDAVIVTPVKSQIESVEDGSAIKSVPTRSGYTFVGWFDEPEGGTKVTSVTYDQKVYAHWKKKSSSSGKSSSSSSDDSSSSSSDESSSTESKSGSTQSENPDRYPSELPGGTVVSKSTTSCELKVHSVDAVTTANQILLVNSFAAQMSQAAEIIDTKNLDAYRELTLVENGSKQTVTWANIDTKYAGPVYAVVYNPTDKAYTVRGKVDETGTAELNNYILRPSSTVTMFKLK